ncbi:hypothetical protein SVIOM74S_09548 [Streptomyces violarus]
MQVCDHGANKLVTSRKPDDLKAFCETFLDVFAEEAASMDSRRPETATARSLQGRRPGRRAAHHRPGSRGRPHRRLPRRRRARSDADGGLPLPGEAHPLRPRADPGAGGARAGRGRVRLFRTVRVLRGVHPCGVPPGPGRAHARVRTVLDRAGPEGLGGHRAGRARLRDQVLHVGGELRPRREQLPGLLHPGRRQVPRLRARGEAGAAQRHPDGRVRARHPVGLRVAPARDAARDHVADVGPGDPAQLPHDAGLRRAHLPVRQRGRQGHVREVPLEAAARRALAGVGRGAGVPGPRPGLQPA